jgi:hypothetical protein
VRADDKSALTANFGKIRFNADCGQRRSSKRSKKSQAAKISLLTQGVRDAPWAPHNRAPAHHGARGVGKTRVVHGIGYAVATGTDFLRWQAPRPRREREAREAEGGAEAGQGDGG